MNVNCQRDKEDRLLNYLTSTPPTNKIFRFLKMVRASLDRQIDTTVIVASCFPLFEQVAIIDAEEFRETSMYFVVTQTNNYAEKHTA